MNQSIIDLAELYFCTKSKCVSSPEIQELLGRVSISEINESLSSYPRVTHHISQNNLDIWTKIS